MKKKSICVVLMLFYVLCHGQGYLLLKNKSVIEYKKWKSQGFSSNLIVTIVDDSESKIDFGEVDGDVTPRTKDFRRIVFNDSTTYGWAERILEGKINLYERAETSGPQSESYVDLFIEKDGRFIFAHSSRILASNKKRFEDFKPLFKDSPLLSELISSPDFKYKQDNIIKAVKKYNLEKFDPNHNPYAAIPITGTKTVTLTFYCNKNIEKDSYITINGEGRINFTGYGPASVPLPVLKPTKVCLTSPSGQYCEIMTSGLDPFTYYEIRPKDQLLNCEFKDFVWAQKQIAYNFQKSKNE